MRRVGAVILAIAVLIGCGAQGYCETADLQGDGGRTLSQEEIHEFVETMFAAVTGTTVETETEIRREIEENAEDGSEEEKLRMRNDENAQYREKTLPWLMEAFRLNAEEEMTAETQTDEEIARTVEDSYEAFQSSEYGRKYLALLAEMGCEGMDACMEMTRSICGMWMMEIDHGALAEMNGDYRFWLYAPGTQIDYPVVQGEDNSYYLHRMFNGERNSAGTLFVDYRNLPDFQDPNTLVYGHHMRNDSMFGSLTDYAEQAYFEAHPYMLIMDGEQVRLMEIFAGYTTSDSDHCYDIAISDEEDMQAFVEEAQRKSDFVAAVEVQMTDRLVTLSTCAYAFEDARYILIGRIVPIWEHDTADCGAEEAFDMGGEPDLP